MSQVSINLGEKSNNKSKIFKNRVEETTYTRKIHGDGKGEKGRNRKKE